MMTFVLHPTWKARLLAFACAFGKDVIKDMLMLKMMFLQRDMCFCQRSDKRYIDDNVDGLDCWIITMFLQRKMAKMIGINSMMTFLTKDILMIMLI